jgi:hypothetical protein
MSNSRDRSIIGVRTAIKQYQSNARTHNDIHIGRAQSRFLLMRMGARPPDNVVTAPNQLFGQHPRTHLRDILLDWQILAILKQPNSHLGFE